MMISFAAVTSAVEADRLFAEEKRVQTCELLKGFTGKVSDAQASIQQDADHILEEIMASGKLEEVELAVHVLISAGMSTPSLRAAAVEGANIVNAGSWSFGAVCFILMMWVEHPAVHIIWERSCGGLWQVAPWIRIAQGLLWFALFVWLGPDQKGFAVSAGIKFAVAPYIAFWLIWFGVTKLFPEMTMLWFCVPDCVAAFLLGPLMLGMAFAGVANAAKLPHVGLLLVHFVMSKDFKVSKWRFCRKHATGSLGN